MTDSYMRLHHVHSIPSHVSRIASLSALSPSRSVLNNSSIHQPAEIVHQEGGERRGGGQEGGLWLLLKQSNGPQETRFLQQGWRSPGAPPFPRKAEAGVGGFSRQQVHTDTSKDSSRLSPGLPWPQSSLGGGQGTSSHPTPHTHTHIPYRHIYSTHTSLTQTSPHI